MRKVAFASLALLLAAGCGVPKEEHQQTLDELKNLKAEMAADRKACDSARRDLSGKLSRCNDENKVMRTKLVSLGQDLSKLKTAQGALSRELSERSKRIAQLLKIAEAAKRARARYEDLKKRFKRMTEAGTVKVVRRRGRMIVQMSDRILFDPGRDRLKRGGKDALKEVVQQLRAIEDRQFQVAGHTDNVPIRNRRFRSNWELSAARAVNVVRFMVDEGMDPRLLSAAGYGPYDPVANNDTAEGRAANRRIEITLVISADEIPALAE